MVTVSVRRPFSTLYPVLLLAALSAPLHAQEKDKDPPPPAPAPAGPPSITLPETVTVKPGRLAVLKAVTEGKVVRWVSLSDGADLVPLPGDAKSALFVAPAPGRYGVLAYTAAGDQPSDPAVCTVVVAGPQPTPPAPPPPQPPQPPAPSDPLVQALAAAFAQETAPQRGQQLATLAALYRQGITVAQQPQLKTVGDLFGVLAAAGRQQLGDPTTVLPRVRSGIAAELKRTLPTAAAAPLDPATRQRCADAFARVASALEAVAAVKGKAVKR